MRLTKQSALLIALGCGAIAALLAYSYLKRTSAAQEVRPAPVSVVVAREDIPAQSIIQAASLTEESLPVEQVPPDAIKDPAAVIGNVATVRISAGKPIRTSQVSERTAALGLTFVVPTGMRAVTVQVDAVAGVAGFLKPGNRVDILATFEVGRETVARTILQDILLLAIGGDASQSAPQPQPEPAAKTGAAPKAEEKAAPKPPPDERVRATATLAVTPVDAQKLIIAAQKGMVRLALRPANEHEFTPVSPIDAYDVIGRRPPELGGGGTTTAPTPAGQPAAAAGAYKGAMPPQPSAATHAAPAPYAPAARPKPSVEVFRGTQRETVTP